MPSILTSSAIAITDVSPIWKQEPAAELVTAFWASRPLRCSDHAYSSAAWLGIADGGAPIPVDAPGYHLEIEQLSQAGRALYLATDLRLVDRPATSDESALLDRALALLDVGDGLGQTLRALVRRVHIVESDGPGFDTSHSDPELPFSIFVSIPIGEKEGALRLAESILHEAMHLHLTLIEAQTQLVEDALAVGYSPWQHRQRPLSGLIHGLFVFRGIEEWLLRLAAMSPNETSILAYAERRRAEIAQEIDLLAWLSHAAGLTSAGTRLVTHLLRQSEGQQANLPPSR